MSKHLQRQIETLKKKILTVGALVEEAIAKSVSSLIHRDASLAEEVIRSDDDIDRTEVDVEEEVLKTLALHQPVAADLRFVIAVLKINSDLERMGDIARNISKKSRFITRYEGFKPPVDFRDMAAKAQTMVRQSLDALVNADTKIARLVRNTDDVVDRMRKDIQNKLENEISLHPVDTECLVRLISVSRHLERLADMATHIAEEVIYMVEGEIVRHEHDDEPADSDTEA
ncbi:MAG: phosphate signaling complex protein PhoU [Pirellulales bacterium]